MGRISQIVAEKTINEAAQRVVSRNPELDWALRRNKHLSDEMFVTLYPDKKVPVSQAKELVSLNVLTDAQFEHLLSFETRAGVWKSTLKHGAPSPDRLDALASSKAMSRDLADKLVQDHNSALSLEWLRQVAPKVGSHARLELWLRAPEDFTDQEISDALQHQSTWGTAKPDRERIKRLLASRPGALPGAARSDTPAVRTTAAGCRHLTDRDLQLASAQLDRYPPGSATPPRWLDGDQLYALMALANNPVVGNDVVAMCDHWLQQSPEMDKRASAAGRLERHPVPVTEPFEQVSSPSQLAWLLSRTLPNDSGKDRLHDLPALLANPSIGLPEAHIVRRKLSTEARRPEIAQAFNTLSDRFPDAALGHLEALEPTPTWAVRDEAAVFDETTTTAASTVTPAGMAYHDAALRYLERELADNEDAWAYALRVGDDGLSGSVADLVSVALAVYV